jgi:hypothetical protein
MSVFFLNASLLIALREMLPSSGKYVFSTNHRSHTSPENGAII